MSTNPPDKRMRFANPRPLNFETRVLRKVIPGGVTLREWQTQFDGFAERVRREMESGVANSPAPESPPKS